MKPRFRQDVIAAALAGVLMFIAGVARAADPLPSWNDGPAKQSILAFVAKVTTPGSPDYVSAAERIATFDNDGTLWCEKPVPVQLYFLLDRVNSLAPGIRNGRPRSRSRRSSRATSRMSSPAASPRSCSSLWPRMRE